MVMSFASALSSGIPGDAELLDVSLCGDVTEEECLLAMNRHPEGITAVQLCEACEKDKAAISRTVAELEQAGLVKRNERNGIRYRSPLTLTEQGEAAARSVSIRAQQAVERAGEGLEDAQREVFYRVLGLIAGNLHAICKDGLKEEA